jgi:hypothetical protein
MNGLNAHPAVPSGANGPLSLESINQLLRTDAHGRLVHRESSSLELKQSFSWGSKAEYARTIVAFANARGGYVVFGVGNSPREIVGLRGHRFEELDDADITAFLNEHFSPEVRIERRSYQLGGHELGVIWTPKAERRPVVCTRDAGDQLRDGDIYYRYRARSQRIRHSELRAIVEEEAERRHNELLSMVLKVARIGAGNAVVLNTADGELFMPDTGRAVLIDEALLKRVKFIKEGSFDEIEGDPTLRIIGDATPAQVVTHEKAIAIHAPEIVGALFGKALPAGTSPADVLRQVMPYEASSYLPVFFFAREAGLTNEEAALLIEASPSSAPTKPRLAMAFRIGHRGACCRLGSVKAGASRESAKRLELKESLRAGTIAAHGIPDADLKVVLQAITHLSADELTLIEGPTMRVLEGLYGRALQDPVLRSLYGHALCHVDCMLYAGSLACSALAGTQPAA